MWGRRWWVVLRWFDCWWSVEKVGRWCFWLWRLGRLSQRRRRTRTGCGTRACSMPTCGCSSFDAVEMDFCRGCWAWWAPWCSGCKKTAGLDRQSPHRYCRCLEGSARTAEQGRAVGGLGTTGERSGNRFGRVREVSPLPAAIGFHDQGAEVMTKELDKKFNILGTHNVVAGQRSSPCEISQTSIITETLISR